MNSEKRNYQVYAFQHPGSRGPFWKHLRFKHAIFFLSPFRACSRLIVDAASPGTISIDINKKYPLEPSVAFQYISGSARYV